MRYLLVTRDARFARALREEGPPDVTFLVVEDTAAAIRACANAEIDGAVLDGALAEADGAEFRAWWAAAAERRALTLVQAGQVQAGQVQAGQGAARGGIADRVCSRDVAGVSAALLRSTVVAVDVEQRRLVAGEAVVLLTPTETSLLAYLIRSERTVAAEELARRSLGYDDERSARIVRTHVSNLRRKCRAASVADPVVTVRGGGYRARGVVLRAAGTPDASFGGR